MWPFKIEENVESKNWVSGSYDNWDFLLDNNGYDDFKNMEAIHVY